MYRCSIRTGIGIANEKYKILMSLAQSKCEKKLKCNFLNENIELSHINGYNPRTLN